MNQSVASYAPKGRTYSLTGSLDTRVAIAAGTQVVGYFKFWKAVFDALGLDLDLNLQKHLKLRDRKKMAKNVRQSSKEGKKRRSENKYQKLQTAHNEWMEQQCTGKEYQSGIAVALHNKNYLSLLIAIQRILIFATIWGTGMHGQSIVG